MFDLREIPLSSRFMRERASRFLHDNGLELDPGVGYLAALYDADDEIAAIGGLDGNVIKCLSVRPDLQGENLGASMVSHLHGKALSDGARNTRVFTKPANRSLFLSMGFHIAGEAPEAIMLESDGGALGRHLDMLRAERDAFGPEGECGAIVMNANPPTLGHLHLIRTAAAQCDLLFIIPICDGPGQFAPAPLRVDALRRSTAGLRTRAGRPVRVLDPSPYCISSASFPSYFLKIPSKVAEAQILLDLDIYTRHIAPALRATLRFVGTEPTDQLTARYNERMAEQLPAHGVELRVVERLGTGADGDAEPVSASRVRSLCDSGDLLGACSMLPPASRAIILAKGATRALLRELDLSPKPGLVDRLNNGAHTDMDHALMARSARALERWFYRMAAEAAEAPTRRADRLVELAPEALKEMYAATGGINTHRGALYSFGLMVTALAKVMASGKVPAPADLPRLIMRDAEATPRRGDTPGARICAMHHIPGAIDMALGGYAQLFSHWLPLLRSMPRSESSDKLLLLTIMAGLEDTNIYHRGGAEAASWVRQTAREALQRLGSAPPDWLVDDEMKRLDREFIMRRLSPGGAADMLALTFLADSLTSR